jgi:hypothetical protein
MPIFSLRLLNENDGFHSYDVVHAPSNGESRGERQHGAVAQGIDEKGHQNDDENIN